MRPSAFVDQLLAEAFWRDVRAEVLELSDDPRWLSIAAAARASAREQREAACELIMREWIAVLEARRTG